MQRAGTEGAPPGCGTAGHRVAAHSGTPAGCPFSVPSFPPSNRQTGSCAGASLFNIHSHTTLPPLSSEHPLLFLRSQLLIHHNNLHSVCTHLLLVPPRAALQAAAWGREAQSRWRQAGSARASKLPCAWGIRCTAGNDPHHHADAALLRRRGYVLQEGQPPPQQPEGSAGGSRQAGMQPGRQLGSTHLGRRQLEGGI